LTDAHIAAVAGTAWLDENRYDRKVVTFRAPYEDDVTDGALVRISDAVVDIDGHGHVRRADIVFDGPKVLNELEVVRCRVS
jgi:hypothetical protein